VFPLSLQVLLRKLNKVQEKKITGNSKEAKQPACCQCSVRRASSSMVFMMWELQAHALQIREILLHENLHELLVLVRGRVRCQAKSEMIAETPRKPVWKVDCVQESLIGTIETVVSYNVAPSD
jgi:hypothetical protein